MNNIQDKQEERLTKIIRQAGFDDPSVDFTSKVMHTIHASSMVKESSTKNYIWGVALLGLIGLTVAGIVFKPVLLVCMTITNNFILTVFTSTTALLFSTTAQLKSISISPIILIVVAALSLLLLLEQWYNKNSQATH